MSLLAFFVICLWELIERLDPEAVVRDVTLNCSDCADCHSSFVIKELCKRAVKTYCIVTFGTFKAGRHIKTSQLEDGGPRDCPLELLQCFTIYK